MRDLGYRPGCEYESILRQKAGEPDLEKVQMAAHEQQKVLKKEKKDVVSAAIVNMPKGFLKPLDYSVDLLIRSDQHPSLREYCRMPGGSTTEVDPEFKLYPSERKRLQVLDEIELKKQSVAKQIGENPPVVSATYMLGLSKTVSGSYVNNLDVPTGLLPGNFGCRVLDNMMPTDLSDVHRDRKNTNIETFVCDNKEWAVPEMMDAPQQVDYLTDDESDDGKEFDFPVPELDSLLKEFEAGDDVLAKEKEEFDSHLADLKNRGFEKEIREEIKQLKEQSTALLDENMTKHKQQLQAGPPGMIEDLNEMILEPKHKIYLR